MGSKTTKNTPPTLTSKKPVEDEHLFHADVMLAQEILRANSREKAYDLARRLVKQRDKEVSDINRSAFESGVKCGREGLAESLRDLIGAKKED